MDLAIGSLFSGIGGLELGLEWAGLGHVAWQVEQDAWCREVLARHWPDAVRHDDVRTVGAHNLAPVDLVCGGFPCQDLSLAGGGAGLAGERSGLWTEYARIVRELRPRFVVVENVPALLSRGLGDVLGELAALGYDAWWDCLPAAAVGAPHRRDRLFVVAWRRLADAGSERERGAHDDVCAGRDAALGCGAVADADGQGQPQQGRAERQERRRAGDGEPGDARPERAAAERDGAARRARAAEPRVGRGPDGTAARLDGPWPAGPGEPPYAWEPPRTARDVPHRQARLKALGNAVVPQVAYAVGCAVRALAEVTP